MSAGGAGNTETSDDATSDDRAVEATADTGTNTDTSDDAGDTDTLTTANTGISDGTATATFAQLRARLRAAESRESSDILLSVLRDGRWGLRSWARFIQLATLRSVDRATANPRAFVEATVIHLGFFVFADRGRRIWVTTSWLMAVTHLGMLDRGGSLGLPNTLTLIRANLPTVESHLGRALPVLSLATDFADGKIARATGDTTPFGAQADFIADTVFWTWFVLRYEKSRLLLAATVAAWAAPVVGLAAAGVVSGHMTDLPRSAWFRPAAVLEIVIGVRAILRMVRARAPRA